MKLVVLLFVALLAVALAGKSQPEKKKCGNTCSFNYAPVCAQDPNNPKDKRTFGNDCVLDNHNCEQQTKLVKISNGACPDGNSGKGGVRLS